MPSSSTSPSSTSATRNGVPGATGGVDKLHRDLEKFKNQIATLKHDLWYAQTVEDNMKNTQFAETAAMVEGHQKKMAALVVLYQQKMAALEVRVRAEATATEVQIRAEAAEEVRNLQKTIAEEKEAYHVHMNHGAGLYTGELKKNLAMKETIGDLRDQLADKDAQLRDTKATLDEADEDFDAMARKYKNLKHKYKKLKKTLKKKHDTSASASHGTASTVLGD